MKIGLWSENLNLFEYKKIRDGYAHRWYKLLKNFEDKNIFLTTFNSLAEVNKFDIIIENGIQGLKHQKKYLIINESPLIRPQDWIIKNHKSYKKIFTWDDNLIDNLKYFKINYAFNIPKFIPKKFEGKKLCCAIAGNKNSKHPDELYSKRVEFLRWFEKYHTNEFDLYGVGWDEKNFGGNFFGKTLNKFKFLRKLCASKYPSYKGIVKSKNETMKNYKFSICYENIKDQNGYITEKIFDSFFAGCVPIYWGAKNITEYIPEECFIDKRAFENYAEIYNYIKNMNKQVYLDYLNKIENFLNDKKVNMFKSKNFASTIVTEILKDIR